ncbi:uncharacterized protein Tco025E_09487 [Trypanosoma conorhini]|uniref:Uncharacterized protein n=1 Tax=Trypanosoma conorhini TaxID=83891 RepID=A0A3R7KM91_9TRYP|nr:uncharacterized protein Tco025E_09487 [Trypanosoma conorhini]RNE97321.1 hypothetical protein Tco025E_09487 [Trypanosoma conorhini]
MGVGSSAPPLAPTAASFDRAPSLSAAETTRAGLRRALHAAQERRWGPSAGQHGATGRDDMFAERVTLRRCLLAQGAGAALHNTPGLSASTQEIFLLRRQRVSCRGRAPQMPGEPPRRTLLIPRSQGYSAVALRRWSRCRLGSDECPALT